MIEKDAGCAERNLAVSFSTYSRVGKFETVRTVFF